MIKYIEYINENQIQNFKLGDIIVYKPTNKIGVVDFIYANDKYTLNIDNKYQIADGVDMALLNDLTKEERHKLLGDSIKKNKDIESFDFKSNFNDGDRVMIDGVDSNQLKYDKRTGTISKIVKNGVLVELDEDKKRNLASYASLIKTNILTKIDDRKLSIGDIVLNKTKNSRFYGIEGEVVDDLKDGSYVVKFIENGTIEVSYVIEGENLELVKKIDIVKKDKSIDFENKEDINKNNNKKIGPNQLNINFEEEEEEDDDDSISSKKNNSVFKKEDLLEISYEDLLDNSKISDMEHLLKIKDKYEKMSVSDNPFKKAFNERTLKNIEIVESYYNFLINKIADGLPVYRTIEEIDDIDLIKTKTKVKASESKEMSKKYSFDQGIILYWKFKDAIVFKTI